MKVVGNHAATGLEVSVVGPASAAQADLQRLALQKLKARLRSQSSLSPIDVELAMWARPVAQ